MIKYAKALVLLFSFYSSAAAQCQNTANLTCAVYDVCFNKFCPCAGSSHEYFISYGKKYCERFIASSGWSSVGNSWRNKTLQCLQEKIVPHLKIVEPPQCDCEKIKDVAYKSHVSCYLSAGVCSLQCDDYKKIYDIIDTVDLFGSTDAAKQMLDTMRSCPDVWNTASVCIKQEGGKIISKLKEKIGIN